MPAAKHKANGRAKKHRASWRGNLTFGLVTFPVEAFNAIDRERSDIHFHQLHDKCHNRIRYQKVCPIHGEVSHDEIVSGYEYKKGRYIEVEPEELEALRTESERALKIDAFVPTDTVDPLYFDGRMYYLTPAGSASQEPYAVIVEAMEREDRHGIGHVIFSGKDQLVLLRPLDGVLHMAMLNYEHEIKPPAKVAASIEKPKGNLTRQVRLAQSLIEQWSQDDFDFSKYEDPYREKVEELIRAKTKGVVPEPPPEEEPREVLNLMDALRKSVGELTRRRGKHRAHRKSA